jgi:bifunctional DNA-binding transcriptional regulator/antitoxin component of YhaV-PrlF toxin-antitoxin module
MQASSIKSVTMTSKGQVTLSSKIRKKLGFLRGATFIEVLIGNCVLLVPEDRVLSGIMARAQEALKDAGVTAKELLAEVEKVKVERFTKKYPKLAKSKTK